MPAFSRIALAAALLEYDNDSDDPAAVKRFARDSALFLHLRNSGPIPAPQNVKEYEDLPEPRRPKDFLRVPLPVGDGRVGTTGRRPMSPPSAPFEGPPRRSRDTRRSLDVLREQGEQYFQGGDGEEAKGSDASEDDVDLQSWGLDSLIPPKPSSTSKDKPSRRPGPAKPRPASQHLDNIPLPHSPQDEVFEQEMPEDLRAASLFGDAGLRLNFSVHDAPPSSYTFPLTGRRPSFSSPLNEFGEMLPTALPRSSSPATLDPASVPFPPSRETSIDLQEDDPTFAVPLPDSERISKFDPKAARHSRTLSSGSWIMDEQVRKLQQQQAKSASDSEEDEDEEDEEDEAADPEHSPGPSVRTGMADGGGNRQSQAIPPSMLTDYRRSTLFRNLRPKVLVMPSPLRDQPSGPQLSKDELRRRQALGAAGFEDSTGDRPLPAGFRTPAVIPPAARPGPRPLTQNLASLGVGSMGELLTPNPRMSMSTSQMMFRNSLMTGGERDVTYIDMERDVRRAKEDGEKIEVEEGVDFDLLEQEFRELQRPSGKLHGHSLMDALEARKNEIRGKRRVFTGDDRPSMMDRRPVRRGTLIDPEHFNMPAIAVVDGDGRPLREGEALGRRPSMLDKRASTAPAGPLVNLEGGSPTAAAAARPEPRTTQTRSVFGVDTLWEKELSKLEKIKLAEKLVEEEAQKEEARAARDKKGGRKSEALLQTSHSAPVTPNVVGDSGKTKPDSAPLLPDIALVSSKAKPRPPPQANVSEDEDEVDENGRFVREGGRRRTNTGSKDKRRVSSATLGVKGWFAGSSDEDDRDARTPISRSRTPNSTIGRSGGPSRRVLSPSSAPRLAPVVDDNDDDDDEDAPLAARVDQLRASVFFDDPDEDTPLADLKKSKLASPVASRAVSGLRRPVPKTKDPENDEDEDEDDDEPLGVRATRLFSSSFKLPSPVPQSTSLTPDLTASSSPKALSPTSPPGDPADSAGKTPEAHADDNDDDDEEDDDKPLGLRYADANAANQMQQYTLAIQQQQQQQMYMQQLARNSMANFSSIGGFNPMMGMGMSVTGSTPAGMFGHPGMIPQMTGGMPMPMSMPMPMPMPVGMMMPGVGMVGPGMGVSVGVQPSPADAAKIGRVDAWRKGVAEGA